MHNPRFSPDEQFQLIMECRQSGLSDARWCMEHGIKPGTFYNWVSRLRKKGVTLPEPIRSREYLPDKRNRLIKRRIYENSVT